ncbi:MAG: hypothetical protein B6D34_11825 [Candidatus Brocadia sp. UTAMX1]|jgi:signal transduction histidine kinase|nr:MAG: hypothetical protein B6D34_11825 [Candidatus Brocadia sp. UTAMX1]
MFSIRTKLILFMSMLIIIIGTLSCLFFLIHSKWQQEEVLQRFGTSLVTLLAQDNEVKYAIRSSQPAFLDTPIKRVRELDREDEISYLRISNNHAVMVEEKSPQINTITEEIPTIGKNQQCPETSLGNSITTTSGEVFCDFSVPVLEIQTFSEEEFAAQMLGEGNVIGKKAQPILGFVQIGLSHHKLEERIHKIIWQSIIPLGIFIVIGGIFTTFFLTRYLVSPLRRMASITLDIARGDFNRTVEIHSNDEIGQLSTNFNQMAQSLRGLCDEKEKIMAQLRENVQRLSLAKTELEEAQERLVRTEKLAAIGKLASGIGHELRNPLGVMRNALFILKKRIKDTDVLADNQKLTQLTYILEKETERSVKIVNDLLAFSRTTKPTVSLTDIRSLLESSLSRLEIPEKIKKVMQFEDPLPLLYVDATQIEQVFINLVQNACDAMPTGGQLTIHAEKENDFLNVTFTDTGCGIPDTIKDKIFEPLFTTKPKGLGLGLAVSFSIVQKHGGCIDLKSKEGEGSTFIVKLPVAIS